MGPTAILCADLHIREDQPKCRLDDFWETQIKKMKWLKELQEKYDCPVLCSGDYFHHWKPSPRLLSACIEYMPFVFTIPGNHDLPNHSLDLIEKSGLWTMKKSKKVEILRVELGKAFPYLQNFSKRDIAILHKLINHPKSDHSALSVMGKLEGFDLVLSGDNHQCFDEFIVENGRAKQILVNPGSFSRQTTEQIHFEPNVVLWYAGTNEITYVPIPIEQNVVSREHLERLEERDGRMDAFVSNLKSDYDLELSFEANLKNYFSKNRTRKNVEEMVWESMEG